MKGSNMKPDDLIGKRVLTGSPGYENLETIESVSFSDAWREGTRIRIVFESGYTTNMDPDDFEFFLDRREASYSRWFGSKADRALETIALTA